MAMNPKSPDQGTNVGANDRTFENAAADGAIQSKSGEVVLSKGSAGAYTLAAPIAGLPYATPPGDDGKVLRIVAVTAFAHVVTSPVRGFNGKAASGTSTWTAAKGNAVVLMAFNGDWYSVSTLGVAIA
jgi:hypothetical protein